MGYRSSVLIVILVFGVLFSTLYISSQLAAPRHPPNVIPTEPKISQLQVIETVEQHLSSKIPNLQEVRLYFSLYNFSLQRYETDNDYTNYIHQVARGGWAFSDIKKSPELLNLSLFFVHANGTQYAINSTDRSYQMLCLQPPDFMNCAFNGFAANAVKDRLVYRTETRWQPPTEEVPYNEGYHIVDAETGELVWNSIDQEKNRKLAPPNIDYEGNESIKLKISKRLNPQSAIEIEIVQGSSSAAYSVERQRNEDFFVPREVRATVAIDNKVIWTNKDTVAHTVRSDEGYSNPYTGKFSSDLIEPHQQYEYTLIEVGEYAYHCEIHPWMQGKVEIIENFA